MFYKSLNENSVSNLALFFIIQKRKPLIIGKRDDFISFLPFACTKRLVLAHENRRHSYFAFKSAPDFPTITFVRGRRQAASCTMDEDTAAGIGWSFKRGASIVMFFHSKGIPPAIVGKQVYPKTISPISSALSTRYLGQRASSSVRGRNPHVTPQAVTRALSAVCISTAESPT